MASSSGSRGKKLLTLALNQQFNEKLKYIKHKHSQKRQKVQCDEEYFPISEDDSDEEICCAEKFDKHERTAISKTDTKKSSQNNVVILSDVIVCPSTSTSKENCDTSVSSFVNELLDDLLDNVLKESNHLKFTKKGSLRKRKKYVLSLKERKRLNLDKSKEAHGLKQTCRNDCSKKCSENINYTTRLTINKEYWSLSKAEQRNFILNSTTTSSTKRKTVGPNSRRKQTVMYSFKDGKGLKQTVCKTFFLATIGYFPNNAKVVRNVLANVPCNASIKAKVDGRSSNKRKAVVDREIIKCHIESFGPQVSHYRREHAPRRRYLPNDVTIQFMYNDFKSKFPNTSFSYCLYRQIVADLNISFTKLGHEECWACETFLQHCKSTGHKKENFDMECQFCCSYNVHSRQYIDARKEYQKDAKDQNSNKLTVSADLQKVIMLPRCDTFKEVIFVPRIIAFNESFIPAGKERVSNPTAVIWHEGLMGRLKANIINTFFAYFLSIRDFEHVTLWLDNCSAQNKNWALYSFFIYLINSNKISLKTLDVKYFEPGHTFMAADSFHHQVEVSLKRKGKVYDFADFKDAVINANRSVNVIEITLQNMFKWKDCTSQYKLNKISPRPYLSDMVWVTFKRGRNTLSYRKSFDGNDIEVNILTAKDQKQGISQPANETNYRGISKVRKHTLLTRLSPIIPKSRLIFWENLPESSGDNEQPLEDNE